MCCASIFTCIMTMISDVSIIFIFSKPFLGFKLFFLFCNYNILLRLDVILVLLLLTVTFFYFQNQLYFLRVLLEKYKTFSYSFFHDIKYAYFLYDQIGKLLILNICKEYAHLVLLLQNFLHYLFIHRFFKKKIQCQHK